MIEHFKRLSQQTLIYGLGDVIIKAIAFILIPLYTRKLALIEYGELALLQAIEVALPIILSFGFNSAILKVVNDYESESEKKQVISTALIFIFMTALPVVVLLIAFSRQLALLIEFSSIDKYTLYLQMTFGTVFFNLFRLIALAVLRVYERGIAFSVINIIHFTTLVGLNILNVAILDKKLAGVIQSSFFTSIIIGVLVTIAIFRRLSFSFSRKNLKELFSFGLPLVPGGLANWTLTLADHYLLKFISDAEQVALYNIGLKFGMIVNMLLVHPFRTAWLPFIFSIQHDKHAKRIYATTFTYYMVLGLLLCLFLSVLAREIVTLAAAEKYLPGYRVIPLIAISYLFYGIYYTVDVGVLLTAKTGIYAIISWIGAMLDLVLAFVLIPPLGMMGAGLAKLLSFLALAVIMYFFSQRFYPIKYETRRISRVIIFAGVIYISSLFVQFDFIGLNIAVKLMLILLFPIALVISGFFTTKEKEIALNFIKKRFKLGARF